MQGKPSRSAESNFITLLNFIADPAVIVDEKGRFLVVNDAFMDLTGLKKKARANPFKNGYTKFREGTKSQGTN